MYTVQKCSYKTNHDLHEGYVIENPDIDPIDLVWVNRYLHMVAVGSKNSARQYAYRLCLFLNFLESRGRMYSDAEDSDISRFLRGYQYDLNAAVTSISEQRISPESLLNYYTPIRGLYIYLYRSGQPVRVTIETIMSRKGKNTYLAGIVDTMPKSDLIIDGAFRKGVSNKRKYIRWYTDEQKDLILANFNTKRDAAIFSISLDGFRIDEILSSRMNDYNERDGILTPYRSKRKDDGSELRSAVLSDRSMRLLDDYFSFEREPLEMELVSKGIAIPENIFINLKGEHAGEPVHYCNWWKVLKRTAARAGLDPTLIRTHSGRSTRAHEVFTDRQEHPDKWSDQEILDMFGWSSMDSANPYVHHADPRRQINIAKKLHQMDEERRRKYTDD